MRNNKLINVLTANGTILEVNGQNEKTAADQYDVLYLPPGVLEQAGKGRADDICYIEYMETLLPLLKEDGRVLLVAENRYGIRNWCGKKETYTGMPFEGIAGYQTNTAGRAFHRRQLQEILKAAGLPAFRFYYPMPDYENAVRVYTDLHLPLEEEAELLGQLYLKKDRASLLFNDTEVLKDIISNGSFPFFANYFVIEAGRAKAHFIKEPDKVTALTGYAGDREVHEIAETDVLQSVMRHNRYLLAAKGYAEIIKEYPDQALIDQVMQVQLDLLKRLQEVCDRHGLRLYAMYGTLLGAVRHGGIIPGDDDIDVALPREDYNRLLKLTDEFEEPYFLQTPWNDTCFFGGYLKLRNRNTTAINPQNWWVQCCEGIGIDIFPLDYGYHNAISEMWKIKRICFYQRLLYAKSYGYFARFQDMPLLIWKAYKYFGKLFTRQWLANRLNDIMASGNADEEAPFGIYAHYTKGKGFMQLPQKAFQNMIQLEYEDMILNAPAGYDKVLEKKYGKNFMHLLYDQKGKRRHGFYAVDVPYQNYKKRFAGLFHPEPKGKEIVLFADNTVIDLYFEWHGTKFRPNHIVALSERCLPEEVQGIAVTPFGKYKVEDKNRIYPIICSIFIRDMEQKLRKEGYREYYFFAGNREWMLLADPGYEMQVKDSHGKV